MDTLTLFQVKGTTFRFEELFAGEDLTKPPYSTLIAERATIRRKAEAVKPVKTRYTPRKPSKAPKPGNGEFEPAPGAPGSSVDVVVKVGEWGRTGFHEHREEHRGGCVMFPAPGGKVWVSLWDGHMPVSVWLHSDNTAAVVHISESEYEHRFGAASAAA